MKPKIAIVLRGHLRNSLNEPNLNDFLIETLNYFDLDLYIQSWNKIDATKTWTGKTNGRGPRKKIIKNNRGNITSDHVFSYFKPHISSKIKCIKILDENKIKLIGSLDGNVGKSRCPLISWKRMWYGVNEIVSEISENNKYIFVLNTRFDIFDKSLINFCNMCSTRTTRPLEHREFIISISRKNFIDSETVYSMYNRVGCDNFYISSTSFMKKIVNELHFNLDEIVDKMIKSNLKTGHQEVIFKNHCNKIGNFVQVK